MQETFEPGRGTSYLDQNTEKRSENLPRNTLGARGFFLAGGDRIERRSREGESRSGEKKNVWHQRITTSLTYRRQFPLMTDIRSHNEPLIKQRMEFGTETKIKLAFVISTLKASKWSQITLCILTNVPTCISERFCPNFEQINIPP